MEISGSSLEELSSSCARWVRDNPTVELCAKCKLLGEPSGDGACEHRTTSDDLAIKLKGDLLGDCSTPQLLGLFNDVILVVGGTATPLAGNLYCQAAQICLDEGSWRDFLVEIISCHVIHHAAVDHGLTDLLSGERAFVG